MKYKHYEDFCCPIVSRFVGCPCRCSFNYLGCDHCLLYNELYEALSHLCVDDCNSDFAFDFKDLIDSTVDDDMLKEVYKHNEKSDI